MSDRDLNEKNIERACNDELTRRLLNQIIGKPPAKLMRPDMRPHTWVFLRDKADKEEPVTCLGIVFKVWDRAKFNPTVTAIWTWSIRTPAPPAT